MGLIADRMAARSQTKEQPKSGIAPKAKKTGFEIEAGLGIVLDTMPSDEFMKELDRRVAFKARFAKETKDRKAKIDTMRTDIATAGSKTRAAVRSNELLEKLGRELKEKLPEIYRQVVREIQSDAERDYGYGASKELPSDYTVGSRLANAYDLDNMELAVREKSVEDARSFVRKFLGEAGAAGKKASAVQKANAVDLEDLDPDMVQYVHEIMQDNLRAHLANDWDDIASEVASNVYAGNSPDMKSLKQKVMQAAKYFKATAGKKVEAVDLKEGDLVKVGMDIVRKHDNMPPYLRLVQKVIRNAEGGTPYVSEVSNGKVALRSWSGDILGDVWVPVEAVVKVGTEKATAGKRVEAADLHALKIQMGSDKRVPRSALGYLDHLGGATEDDALRQLEKYIPDLVDEYRRKSDKTRHASGVRQNQAQTGDGGKKPVIEAGVGRARVKAADQTSEELLDVVKKMLDRLEDIEQSEILRSLAVLEKYRIAYSRAKGKKEMELAQLDLNEVESRIFNFAINLGNTAQEAKEALDDGDLLAKKRSLGEKVSERAQDMYDMIARIADNLDEAYDKIRDDHGAEFGDIKKALVGANESIEELSKAANRYDYEIKFGAKKTAAKDDELEKGKKVEKEHGDTYGKIKEHYEEHGEFPPFDMVTEWIAGDHLKEFKDYYEALEVMEKELKAEKKEARKVKAISGNTEKAINKAVNAYWEPKLGERGNRLINWLNSDLYYGPYAAGTTDEEGTPDATYPGFTAAVDELRGIIDSAGGFQDMWYDNDSGELMEKEPEGWEDEETGEYIEPYLEETYALDGREVARYVLGKELVSYVR